ncbi:PRC-barrel domain-containing protein [Cohnella terricola]|uniref:Photosystem reaction center subunit H n=1 Tax=Cohnella terricola TaxID=1289167 RepID=A0A559JKQ4_9BACL|nr:PRC-barrel domain-containing protein [Cohnella terricola]TVY00458.1 photosystem reaction center subunit H [Cohnella terricola]
MFQVERILGLPVLRESGKGVGKVKDVWFDEFWRLVGFVLDKYDRAGFIRKLSRIVYLEDIVHLGEDALLIRGDTAIASKDGNELLRTYDTGIVRLKDMPVYTIEGQYLGKISDVYFKSSEGTQIIGYELTDGFLADVFEGRRRLLLPEAPENMTLGEDAILVPASYERILTRDHTWKVTGEDG